MANPNLPENELLTHIKAQFFHDCLAASLKKESSGGNGSLYAIDWDSFEKHLNSQNILVSETVTIASNKLIKAINGIKQLGRKLKSKKVAARLLSSIR